MIFFNEVSKEFSERPGIRYQALDRINFHVKQGEFILLDGVSGSGKSTILSLMSGVLQPTSGEVKVAGEWINKLSDRHLSTFRREQMGIVFQHLNLLDDLTTRENVFAPLIPSPGPEKSILQKVEEVLEFFHIAHKSNVMVKLLSGGERQRVAMARAWVNRPSILLADEPTAHIDSKKKIVFQKHFSELKKQGVTIVIASHDSELRSWPEIDRVITVEDGKVVSP